MKQSGKYRSLAAEVLGKPWLMDPSVLHQLCAVAHSGIEAKPVASARSGRTSTAGSVAVIPIRGVISQRSTLMMSWGFGGASTQRIAQQLRAALDDSSVKAIVFDVDSPGGGVEGVPELADEIYRARGKKKMVAVCNSMMASAAYWIASAADEIVCTPSGLVGSVGVFTAHFDYSEELKAAGILPTFISFGKYKTEGNPYEPLSPEAQANMQAMVDTLGGQFVKALARNRGVSAANVAANFGEGRIVLSAEAKTAKMIDRIATLDETLARFGVASATPRVLMASAGSTDMDDEDDEDGEDSPKPRAGENCSCKCLACQTGNCEACSNAECEDPNCDDCPQNGQNDDDDERQAKSRTAAEHRRREIELLAL